MENNQGERQQTHSLAPLHIVYHILRSIFTTTQAFLIHPYELFTWSFKPDLNEL